MGKSGKIKLRTSTAFAACSSKCMQEKREARHAFVHWRLLWVELATVHSYYELHVSSM
ncbi:hypothetical protein FEM48_Zijuj10G0092500 [Ziziphus jujuba var. spinosa]|uniref:Uncharacterized protein n=1 Tax=Ziziphus jujuba var. spinosa TaxID=714518 RepID=A0A978UMJ0_ZIZJJ|nr:hypothetical protein FEM48_Zijuj10G0092500 [Ziziphus jujuba var. spinosa]